MLPIRTGLKDVILLAGIGSRVLTYQGSEFDNTHFGAQCFMMVIPYFSSFLATSLSLAGSLFIGDAYKKLWVEGCLKEGGGGQQYPRLTRTSVVILAGYFTSRIFLYFNV
ncbi:hypothetical protein CDAR_227291 [Caerostris darwini]|uniref:Uncharacterized protein n=1 Tax=Caerostris darwini TaxID=1538125 RepID=A0AAV4UMJ2_9ARAC|nr:hypothetical protein CDAR_227291 [Caerostris darwini]